MSEKFRLKHKDGTFAADNYHHYNVNSEWLCEDYVEKLRSAAQLPAAPLELKTVVNLLANSTFEDGRALRLPHTAQTQAAFDAALAERTVEIEDQKKLHSQYYGDAFFDRELQQVENSLNESLAPKKPQRWIHLKIPPYLRWIETPGKALMKSYEEWEELIARFDKAQKVIRLLPAAVRQAKKLGFNIEPWEVPDLKKIPTALQKLAGAQMDAFIATEAYLSRECYAVFRGDKEKSGFLDHKGELQPDLGAARLYPSVKDAKRGVYRDGAIVKVDVVPRSFEIIGSSEYLNDLKQAISAREALELEEALEMANIEQLRAALKAKEAEVGLIQELKEPVRKKTRL